MNALGVDNAVLKEHAIYTSLGVSGVLMCNNYKVLFGDMPAKLELDMIRTSLHSGRPIGNDKFKAQVEQAVGLK